MNAFDANDKYLDGEDELNSTKERYLNEAQEVLNVLLPNEFTSYIQYRGRDFNPSEGLKGFVATIHKNNKYIELHLGDVRQSSLKGVIDGICSEFNRED